MNDIIRFGCNSGLNEAQEHWRVKWNLLEVQTTSGRSTMSFPGFEWRAGKCRGLLDFLGPLAQSLCFWWISSLYGSSPYPDQTVGLCLIQPDVEVSSFLPLCFCSIFFFFLKQPLHIYFILLCRLLWEERRIFCFLPKQSPSGGRVGREWTGEAHVKKQVDQLSKTKILRT